MADPPKPPALPVDVQLAIFTAIQGVHEKLDLMHANLRERNDDVLALKQRQNRHGRKLGNLDARVTVLETARPALAPPPMRAPMPSVKEWDPEDTSPHMLAPADLARIHEIAERDRATSDFYRGLPRAALVRVVQMIAAVVVTSLVTWLVSHH